MESWECNTRKGFLIFAGRMMSAIWVSKLFVRMFEYDHSDTHINNSKHSTLCELSVQKPSVRLPSYSGVSLSHTTRWVHPFYFLFPENQVFEYFRNGKLCFTISKMPNFIGSLFALKCSIFCVHTYINHYSNSTYVTSYYLLTRTLNV